MGILSSRRRALAGLLATLVWANASTLSPQPAYAATDTALVVVVAAGNKLTNISLADLRRAFTSERMTDPQGDALVPFNHPPRRAERVSFDSVVLKMDAESVARFWIDRRIRGTAGPPRTVANLAMLRQVVAKLPGAIAYVRASELSNEVKAIRVNGKLPGDAEYPLG